MNMHNVLRRFAHGSLCLTLSLFTWVALQSFDASAAGTFDILWRNAISGEDSIWVMNGTPLASSAFLQPNIPAPWQIVGNADFDGDGKPDILWRNSSTGQNAIWLMNGATTVNSAFLTTVADPNWTVAGIGDFDGDGKADILWRNIATGENSIWLMNGLSIAGSGFLPRVADPNWTIAGVGSFSGNVNTTTGLLKTDILWRNTATGQNSIWFMDGTTLTSSAFITTVATTWAIAGVGDYNGDRKADILWRNASTGEGAIWFMNGASIASSAFTTSVVDPNWKVVGTADYNGDGIADILWRNSATGENVIWLMNGASIVSSGFLPKVADANWVPRSPTPVGPPLPTSGTVAVALVGPGTTDPSVHQLVRTSKNILYVVAPDGTTGSTNPSASLRVHKADVAGTPGSFTNKDDAHAPGGGVNCSDSAIDGQDRIHTIWIDGQGNVLYAVFNTGTDVWGATTTLETNGFFSGAQTQGDEGIALALDSAGNPHAVWITTTALNQFRAHYATLQNGSWSVPVAVEELVIKNSWHPALAFAPSGDLTVAWLDGSGGYALDAVVRTRVRHANGTWDATLTLPDTTHVSADNGPSMLITADGVRHITFVNYTSTTLNTMRYWYDAGSGWRGDQQPTPTVSHDPVLGPDGSGGLYIYAHGVPLGDPKGSGDGKFRFHKAAHGSTWSAFIQIAEASATGQIDDATSTRWSQFFHNFPKTVDFTYWPHAPGNPTAGYTIYIGTQAP